MNSATIKTLNPRSANLGNPGLLNSLRNSGGLVYFNYSHTITFTVILIGLFVLQNHFHLSPDWLIALQHNSIYKQLTGFALFGFLCLQWRLASSRHRQRQSTRHHVRQHQYVGMLAPVGYFIHTTEYGFAYQFLLSMMFFVNCVVGCLNPKVLRLKFKSYYQCWLLTHISLVMLITILALYHIYITYAY